MPVRLASSGITTPSTPEMVLLAALRHACHIPVLILLLSARETCTMDLGMTHD